ncbi:MAG: membrane associated rhomboid family serine protease [Rhodothermales bacterium]|jgi:membrane associated rhomboid family serine protease
MGFSDRDYAQSSAGGGYRPVPPAGPASLVKLLIIANVVVFFCDYLSGWSLTSFLALSTSSAFVWQIWRFFTYMFCHGDVMHILMNMYCLYIFGGMVERKVGRSTLWRLYVVSGLVGAACWAVFNWGSPHYLVGASGAVFGVMAACALLYPNDYLQLLIPPMPMRVRTFVIVVAVIEVLMLYRQNSNVAHLAHLGGMFAGYYYIRQGLMGPKPGKQKKRVVRKRRSPPDGGPQPDLRFVPDENELDRILDKVSEFGSASLSGDEREILDRHAKRLSR